MSFGPSNKKQYGLIIPKAKEQAPVRKRPLSAVFNVDSDDEDGQEHSTQTHLKKNIFKNIKRQAKIDMQRALEDDPTVYHYDEVYDDMKQTKQNQILESKKDKTSKYAKSLIRNAALRKLENDRHFEKKCQKELEEEGDEYADKETFVTSSYKKKLAELAELEEEIKRKAEEEKINDVTKKADLTDFYRNILAKRTEVASSAPESPPLQDSTDTPPPKAPETSAIQSVNIRKIIAARRQYRAKQSQRDAAVTDESGSSDKDDNEANSGKSDDNDKQDTNLSKDDHVTVEVKDNVPVKESETGDDNEDRDDSNASSSESEDDEASKSSKIKETGNLEGESLKEATDVQNKNIAKMSDEERNEYKLKIIKEQFRKRNTPETIEAAKARYWQRRSIAV